MRKLRLLQFRQVAALPSLHERYVRADGRDMLLRERMDQLASGELLVRVAITDSSRSFGHERGLVVSPSGHQREASPEELRDAAANSLGGCLRS